MALPMYRVLDPLKTPTGAVESPTGTVAVSNACTSTPVGAGMISAVATRILTSAACPAARESRHSISTTSLRSGSARETPSNSPWSSLVLNTQIPLELLTVPCNTHATATAGLAVLLPPQCQLNPLLVLN